MAQITTEVQYTFFGKAYPERCNVSSPEIRAKVGGYLQRCLADLREAIRNPKDTGFFCYRAIESLRQFFLREKAAKDDKSSWEMLRSELGVDRADIDTVKALADSVRHGDSVVISDDQRAKTFLLTWGIVNNFVKYASAEYKKG